jgi:RNase P/RNase MRP subunit p29
MQKEIKGLLNKNVSIWSELNGKSLRILNGNLMESNSMKDGYLVVNGENTLSFSGQQVSKIDKTNLYLKFTYKG